MTRRDPSYALLLESAQRLRQTYTTAFPIAPARTARHQRPALYPSLAPPSEGRLRVARQHAVHRHDTARHPWPSLHPRREPRVLFRKRERRRERSRLAVRKRAEDAAQVVLE